MPSLRTILAILACHLYAAPVFALPLYAELGYMYHYVEAGDTELNPATAKLMVGAQIAKSVTLDAVYAASTGDDTINDLQLEIDNIQAVYLRLHSSLHGSGSNLSLFLGHAKTTISTSNNGIGDTEEFDDFSWGIGLEDRSKASKNLFYTLEYIRFYDDADLSISGASLGIKYTF